MTDSSFSKRTEFFAPRRGDRYARRFGAKGFRAAALTEIADWFDVLEFSYDMSIPNVAHLRSARGGCCTVFPFFIGDILELAVTTIQDYSLFHMFNDFSMRLWKQQIDLIRNKMA